MSSDSKPKIANHELVDFGMYTCPSCGGVEFTRWKLPHPMILFWILFPALAFNELVLGQRIPKLMLICKKCSGPMYERSYVPCPKCKTMHIGTRWSKAAALFNWFGYVCPTCHSPIPCLWNGLSWIILVLTAPIWYLPAKLIRPYWLSLQITRLAVNAERPRPKLTKKHWILMGVFWGGVMFVFTSLPLFRDIFVHSHWEQLWLIPVGFILWGVGGFLFAFFMWFFLGRPKKTNLK